MENILEQIIDYTDKAHGEQRRKYTPERYIVHPLRVMNTCKRVTDDLCILGAAVMHDVLEDTAVQKNEMEIFLRTLMPEHMALRTLHLVVDLTDVFVKKDYPHLNRRSRKANELLRLQETSADSQTIKYADIMDNSREIIGQDADFARVYLYECWAMLQKLNKGNKLLYNEALSLVDSLIKKTGKNKRKG